MSESYRGICYDCGLKWNATSQAHCATCHVQFNSDSAFDRHREGVISNRRCIPVERFGENFGKTNKPRLVSTVDRLGTTVWMTGFSSLRSGSESTLQEVS